MQKVWGLLFVFLGQFAHAESCRLDPSLADHSKNLLIQLLDSEELKPKNPADYPTGDNFIEHSTRYLSERYNLFLREMSPDLHYLQRQEMVEDFEKVMKRYARNAPSLPARFEHRSTWKMRKDFHMPNLMLKIIDKVNDCLDAPAPQKPQVFIEDFMASLAELLKDKLLEAYKAARAHEVERLAELSDDIMEVTAFAYMTISKAKPDAAIQNKYAMRTLHAGVAAFLIGTLAIPADFQNSYLMGSMAFMGLGYLNETIRKIPRLNEKLPDWVTRIWAYQIMPNFMMFNWFYDDYHDHMKKFWRAVRAQIANTPEFAEHVDGLVKAPILRHPANDGPEWLTLTLRDMMFHAGIGSSCRMVLEE